MTEIAATLPRLGSSRPFVLAGRILTGLVVAFLLMDGAMKLPPIQPVTDAMAGLGWPTDAGTARALGILVIAIALLCVPRRTAFLGTVLLTAYLGGAVATHVRIGSPLLTHTLFGVYLGALAWAGLWLRDERVRALVPFGAGRNRL